jgi:chromosome segregation ATPase
MTAPKRKNDGLDSVTNTMTKLVIVNNSDNDNDNNNKENKWSESTMERINLLRSKWIEQQSNDGANSFHNYDPITQAIVSIQDDDSEPEEILLSQSRQVQSQLSQEIEQAKALCNQESSVLTDLTSQLAMFQEKRRHLLLEIEELEDRQKVSQSKIAKYQEEASQELEVIQDVEEEKKRQVPRLKTTISLYASTTGIKWDFSDPHLLSGQVVRMASLASLSCSSTVMYAPCMIVYFQLPNPPPLTIF